MFFVSAETLIVLAGRPRNRICAALQAAAGQPTGRGQASSLAMSSLSPSPLCLSLFLGTDPTLKLPRDCRHMISTASLICGYISSLKLIIHPIQRSHDEPKVTRAQD